MGEVQLIAIKLGVKLVRVGQEQRLVLLWQAYGSTVLELFHETQ